MPTDVNGRLSPLPHFNAVIVSSQYGDAQNPCSRLQVGVKLDRLSHVCVNAGIPLAAELTRLLDR